ncbi:MBL fold metallo-hydrolase [Emticicia sp. CRIBPO]|uniref:MBL fold metallo-hydrolase n=1 Tax=Emticicia sp. CRIBPO TaxID=2683258 RepID=UPI0014134744|nr:MBL fold metallo-hydrolase [Emticicia sp. CRIBPO]NBA86955.1 MBL fold metallo-hydrolase [Emticicia sp. CRIBPO]
MSLIKPRQQDGKILADIKSFDSPSGFKIWWLAQSGFLISWQGRHLLFDPYLSDSLSVKYQYTAKPHVRMSELVVAPEGLDFIDIVTSSHNHTDHLDAETLMPILKNNEDIKFIIPEANRSFVCDRLKCPEDFPVGLNDGLSFEWKGFKIHGVPAAHNELERNEKGECKFMGFVAQFGEYSVYHSGDTLWYEGIVDILKPFNIDVAFLPINGNKPERKVAGNLNAEEAARLGKEIGAKLVIPHHYDLFEFNTADPKEFEEACEEYGVSYKVLELGEGVVYGI